MEPDEDIEGGSVITLADFTGETDDPGGDDVIRFVSSEAPDHDPFADYPEGVNHDVLPALVAVPMMVTATLAHNLDVRRQRIWACYGHDVQVGWIGDASHQASCSDHNKDSTGVVHAIDPMVTGSRAQAIVNECLAHPGDLQYVIHNRVIWTSSAGWKPRKYTGSDPHTNHVHISGKHGSSHRSDATCTGYDLAAQASTPAFNPCPPPVKPVPPKPKPPVAAHQPGSRLLKDAKPQLSGADVVFVQKFIGAKRAGNADGVYGPKTISGVRWYQGMRGIGVDGQVGPKTWAQMGVRWTGGK